LRGEEQDWFVSTSPQNKIRVLVAQMWTNSHRRAPRAEPQTPEIRATLPLSKNTAERLSIADADETARIFARSIVWYEMVFSP
jgi:hypothetical protein